ncbi:MAG: tetratricopeptide repeat protein [Pseudomonadota bacterium]
MKKLLFGLCATSALALSACNDLSNEEAQTKTIVGVIDETNLNDIMLTTADPNEAVGYFADALSKDPERDDIRRNLAVSLLRARRTQEAASVYKQLDDRGAMEVQDRVNYTDALVRSNAWADAKTEISKVPPSVETYQRYLLEALIADSEKNWKKSDSFYKTASGLTPQPANALNNWGYSKLTRKDYKGAAALFSEAITYNKSMFTAKNNLVLARSAQRNYDLPVIPMNGEERAMLTYTAGLAAVKNGDKDQGRVLIQRAIELHPRHFKEAVTTLEGLG